MDEGWSRENVAGVGEQGFVAVVARAVDGQSGGAFAFASAVSSQGSGRAFESDVEVVTLESASDLVVAVVSWARVAVSGGTFGVVVVATAYQCVDR